MYRDILENTDVPLTVIGPILMASWEWDVKFCTSLGYSHFCGKLTVALLSPKVPNSQDCLIVKMSTKFIQWQCNAKSSGASCQGCLANTVDLSAWSIRWHASDTT